MEKKQSNCMVCASERGLQLLREAQSQGLVNEGQRLTYARISEKSKVSERTVKRFFSGHNVRLDSAIAITQDALRLNVNEVVDFCRIELDKIQSDLEEKQLFLREAIKSKDDLFSSSSGVKNELLVDLKRIILEKNDLEKCLNHLNESIDSLKRIVKDYELQMESSCQAADWLKPNLKALAKEAADFSLNQHSHLKEPGGDADSSEKIERFEKDIGKYLYWSEFCLRQGSYNLLHRAIMQSKFLLKFDADTYISALNFIKDCKAPDVLPREAARELKLCFEYIIVQIQVLS
jgi:uncharacterized protein (UPF0262 family)